jgi:hypothetical protein
VQFEGERQPADACPDDCELQPFTASLSLVSVLVN